MQLKLVSATIIAVLAVGTAAAHNISVDGHVDAHDGYAGSHGTILKSSFGDCVRSSRWSADNAVDVCEGIEPKVEAPAPEPVAVPEPAPEPEPAPLYEKVVLKGHTLFDTNKSMLTDGGKAILDELVHKVKKVVDIEHFKIVGHTDSRGSHDYNQGLSERRATSVKDYFVTSGLGYIKMNTSGVGETSPIASNSTREGRQQNRRVEIFIPARKLVH